MTIETIKEWIRKLCITNIYKSDHIYLYISSFLICSLCVIVIYIWQPYPVKLLASVVWLASAMYARRLHYLEDKEDK